MRVLGKEKLTDFAKRHAALRKRISAWTLEAEEASWRQPQDILERFPRASIIAADRIVFDLGSSRLDVRINYDFQVLIVMRVGTHDEYDRWEF